MSDQASAPKKQLSPEEIKNQFFKDFLTKDFDGEQRVICRLINGRVRRFQGNITDICFFKDMPFIKIISNKIKVKNRAGGIKDIPGRGVAVIPMSIVEHIFSVKRLPNAVGQIPVHSDTQQEEDEVAVEEDDNSSQR